MRLATLSKGTIGAIFDDTVIDILAAGDNLGTLPPPTTLLELIAAGPAAVQAVEELAHRALRERISATDLSEVELVAPIPTPRRNIFCVGKNYREHVDEVRGTALGELPQAPIIFTKATTTVAGPGDPIPAHQELTQCLDYEGEIAVIIGRGGRGITAADAWSHVFGITALNDVTARDIQRRHKQWHLGKSLDGSAPMGPTVLLRSRMPDPSSVALRTEVNGELRQTGTLDQLIFDVPTLIAVISAGITLLPGDIIATGTPSGVGAGFDPPQFLRSGDTVTVEVSGCGRLTNTVRTSTATRSPD